MTLIAVTFFKTVEFRPRVRERRPSTQPLNSRRLCARQSVPLAFGVQQVFPAAGSLHPRRRAVCPHAYANSTGRL